MQQQFWTSKIFCKRLQNRLNCCATCTIDKTASDFTALQKHSLALQVHTGKSPGCTSMAEVLSMLLPPISTIFSLGFFTSEAFRPLSWLWLTLSSASWPQEARESVKSASWLCAMDSFAREVQGVRALPREEILLFFKTRVFSRLASPSPVKGRAWPCQDIAHSGVSGQGI